MKNGPRMFNKSPLAAGIAALLGCAALPVQAVNWESESGDWTISFDSQFSLGTAIRVENRDWKLIGNSNNPRFDWTGYNGTSNLVYPSGDIWAQSNESYSTNNDNGNLNFDAGEAFSTQFKGTHDLDIKYKNMGFFGRAMYFYDFELMDNERPWTNPVSAQAGFDRPLDPCKDEAARDELCRDIRMLDAFFYTDFDMGGMPVSLRLGDQVVSWGESTFIQHGINTTNPADAARALAPGAELKEVFIPVGMLYAQIGLTDNLGMAFYYQYEWEKTRLPQNGSYFATTDFAGEGGQDANIQLGFSGNPDIDLDFLLMRLNQIGDQLRGGVNPALLSSAYLAFPTKVAVRGYSDAAHQEADDQGQYGLKFSYFSEAINDTEFGLYFINYHSQRPLISGRASNFTAAAIGGDLAYLAQNQIDRDNILELDAFTVAEFVYPEDIKLYGFSFNTNIGETAFAGEVAYRQDEPLQIDDVELLYAAMPQQLANAGLRPDLANISQFNNLPAGVIQPGGTAQGYILRDNTQVQFSVTHLFGPALWTDNLTFLAEVGYVTIDDMPDEDFLRLNGPGTSRSGPIPGKEGLHTGLSNGPETNPFPTEDAWGYRLLAKADFNNAFNGVNLSIRATFAHDVDGITPDPIALFVEDRKSSSVSFDFDYLNKWSMSISHNAFWGGVGTTNQLSDRDFVSFNIKYSI
ncbi:DUF1302 domain-containing protein [Aliiglaciecola sp. CAU 1673]|uniref:DUF1302 domain-containing protein n=1 Tax=Aliiglaciecola sp. CAU 1673 TaxID=3032595 RepID=UPI0023DA62F2|nr:DUF1302 domain-containing protein [Aliiglaciecola sp. CAU 1673]MDF2177531.1 DUF1302 domain-containing protein [Aliiglaciecola sp. CAU 1673]